MLELASFEHDDNRFSFKYKFEDNCQIEKLTSDIYQKIPKDIINNLNKIGYKKSKISFWEISPWHKDSFLYTFVKYKKEHWITELYLYRDINEIHIVITKSIPIAVGRALKTIADRLRAIDSQ